VLATPDEPIAKVPPLPAEMATADAPVPPRMVVVDEALVLPRLRVLVCTVVPIQIVPEAPD
jgi:hypothetical protein